MNAKAKKQIDFWLKAKRIIRKGFGKPCKDFNLGCAGCQSNMVVGWIDNHIDTIKWQFKKDE